MNRLLQIGFRSVGHWKLENGNPIYELTALINTQNILYAFISNGEVKYIGKTVQTLKRRMYGYQNPGPTQSTNIKNNEKIRQLLLDGEAVDIFALPDNGLLHYGGFHINLAAGLEDSLISELSPDWNRGYGESKDTSRKNVVSEDDLTLLRENFTEEDPLPIDGTQRFLSSNESIRPIFKLLLHKTYYNQGFFNITVDFDRYFGSDNENIEINVGETNQIITGYINRTANTNGTPRIMGGKELKKWFQINFDVNDTVYVWILSPVSLKLSKNLSGQ